MHNELNLNRRSFLWTDVIEEMSKKQYLTL